MRAMKANVTERRPPFVVFHEAEEGGYWVEIPSMPGCFSDGETLEEARKNILEAAECWLMATLDMELYIRRLPPSLKRRTHRRRPAVSA